MSSIKVLPSVYRGVTYRSRMEARWAVFMDHAGVPFMYEPEGYQIDDLFYLPDFYLPNQDAFMEIKNPMAVGDTVKKPRVLAECSGKNVFVFIGPPRFPDGTDYDLEGAQIFYPVGEDDHYLWCECPHCRRVELQFDGRSDRIDCNCRKSEHGDKGYNSETDRIKKAFEISAAWRFE